jgi:glycosyltransferase involved in cell wall biosynthesis
MNNKTKTTDISSLPLISVIVPIYKVEKYLTRCVDSILNQTWQNLEIILVDDGSPDTCPAICDDYQTKDNRIKVIHKPNGGISDARNAGIDIATGLYIGFVDSDDFIHPDMFSDLLTNLQKFNADIVQCSYKKVSGNETPDPDRKDDFRIITGEEALNFIYTPQGVDYIVVWNKLYKIKLFRTIRFPVSKIHEDDFTTYKLFYEAGKIAVTDARYYYYFQSPGSIMRSRFNEKRLNYAEAMEERIRFFEEHRLENLRNIALKKYALWHLYFYFHFYWSLRKNSDSRKWLRSKYIEVVKQVREIPSLSWRLKTVLAISCYIPIPAGFLVYHQLFKRNFIGRFVEMLDLK